jgi:acyl-CoA thioesterase
MNKPESLSGEMDLQRLLTAVQQSDFYQLLGMEIVEVKPGYSKLRVLFRKALTHAGGVGHGGVMASIADSCIACALFGMMEDRAELGISTIEMKLNYFRPFKEGEMIAEGRIIQKGSSIAVGEMDVHDGKGVIYGKGIATYKL